MNNIKTILSVTKSGAAKYAEEQLALLQKFSTIDHGTDNAIGNQLVIDLMNTVFSTMDLDICYPKNPRGGHHVVARICPEESTGKIILNSHLDTVFKPGEAAAHPFRIDGDWAYGLGIADCMGGFLVSCYAVKILQEAGALPNKEIVLLYNNDEEIGSPHGQTIFQKEAADAEMAFVFEPARGENGVLTSRKGFATCTIEITGKEAHAGLNFAEGRSATLELAHQILALHALSEPDRGLNYNVGPLTGSKRTGSVAGFASAVAGISLHDSDDFEKVCKDMKTLEENVTVTGCSVKATALQEFPPMKRTEGNVRLYELIRDIGLAMNTELPEQSSAGSSDACFFSSYGVPTVDGLGPYMCDIHTFNERLLIPSIRQKTQLFASVLGSM